MWKLCKRKLLLPPALVCECVCGHDLLCVCVQSHAQWPHLLSLSSDVYLERCSSEIKGQKQRVVCSFISAPSDGGWQFLQLTPPDVFTAVACVRRMCVCVCVLPHLGPPAIPDLSDSDILFAAHCEPSISSSRTAEGKKRILISSCISLKALFSFRC